MRFSKVLRGGQLALVSGFLLISLLVSGPGEAAQPVVSTTPQKTGAHSVVMIEGAEPGTWIELKTSRLLKSLPSREPISVRAGGEILWNKIRHVGGSDGLVHEFYEQRYRPAPRTFGRALEIPKNGLKIMGSSLGYHRDQKGHLFGIGGTYFKEINRVQRPTYRKAEYALDRASMKMSEQRTDTRAFDSLDAEMRKHLVEGAELKLASLGHGRVFGLVWSLQLPTTRGEMLNILLDAASGEILNVDDDRASALCEPSTQDAVSMIGESQMSDVFYDDLPATEAFDLSEPGFSYEAHKPPGGYGSPEIILYLGENGEQCSSTHKNYRVFPLKAEGYYDWAAGFHYRPVVPGRSAADAMYNTMLTMEALRYMSWNSYDGEGGVARISVDSNCNGARNSAFFQFREGNDDEPANGVSFCPLNSDSPFVAQLSVALDVVAHEWGHGIIFHSAGIPYSGLQMALHEGFSDVIGYGVEDMMEGTNWEMGEAAGAITRRVDADGAVPYFGFSSFHRCDAESYSNDLLVAEPHASGNKLAVAFRMMALGVSNPGLDGCDYSDYCSQDPTCPHDICDQSSGAAPQAIGTEHAFRFLFELLVRYAPSTLSWEDLPAYATLVGKNFQPTWKALDGKVAVNVLFDGEWVPMCVPYADYDGMQSAHEAFLGIGYRAATPTARCED